MAAGVNLFLPWSRVYWKGEQCVVKSVELRKVWTSLLRLCFLINSINWKDIYLLVPIELLLIGNLQWIVWGALCVLVTLKVWLQTLCYTQVILCYTQSKLCYFFCCLLSKKTRNCGNSIHRCTSWHSLVFLFSCK